MKYMSVISVFLILLSSISYAGPLTDRDDSFWRHPRDKWVHGIGSAVCTVTSNYFITRSKLSQHVDKSLRKYPKTASALFCLSLGLLKELTDPIIDNRDLWANAGGVTTGLFLTWRFE